MQFLRYHMATVNNQQDLYQLSRLLSTKFAQTEITSQKQLLVSTRHYTVKPQMAWILIKNTPRNVQQVENHL